jgi:Fe-S-cluster containining protein
MALPGPCSGCSAPCCRDYLITVTSFDVLRIAERLGKEPAEFSSLQDAKILNLDEDTVLECYEGGLRYDCLLALGSHPCIFLGSGSRCTIHDFAPYTCRSYPFNSAGKVLGRARCGPLRLLAFRASGVSISHGEFFSQMKRYKELVKEWNRKKGTREECWKFLMRQKTVK